MTFAQNAGLTPHPLLRLKFLAPVLHYNHGLNEKYPEPVPLDEAVITVDEVLERKRWSLGGTSTSCGKVALHSGAVRNVQSEEELRRLLERK